MNRVQGRLACLTHELGTMQYEIEQLIKEIIFISSLAGVEEE